MDSCCAAIKARLQPMEINGVLSKRENGVWGERVRGSLKEKALGAELWRNLNRKRARNSKPGVAFSVLTRDINKEMAVNFCLAPIIDAICFYLLCFYLSILCFCRQLNLHHSLKSKERRIQQLSPR